MSGGPACPIKDDQHVVDNHVISQYHQNHSMFNGGRRTPSRYSEVMCLSTGLRWRTTAKYVEHLPIATTESFARMDAGGRPDFERAWAILHEKGIR